MKRVDGGPAYPVTMQQDPNGGVLTWNSDGVTVHDYFAARAPITIADAMLACGVEAHSIGMLPASQRTVILVALATMRGEYADAMLAERAK